MAKLYFRYGAMNCGKTTHLLQVHYNYSDRGLNPLIVKPLVDTKGDTKIVSRLGVDKEVDIVLKEEENLFDYIEGKSKRELKKIGCILVDEAQFLTKEQVDNCYEIVSKLDIPVICYGLRTDYLNRGFKGSQRLLEIAHEISEMKTICKCGKKATINIRYKNDKPTFKRGKQIEIDNQETIKYGTVCSSCYFKLLEEFKEME